MNSFNTEWGQRWTNAHLICCGGGIEKGYAEEEKMKENWLFARGQTPEICGGHREESGGFLFLANRIQEAAREHRDVPD